MNKKLLVRYVLICLPFVLGTLLFSFGVFNFISSILFFAGGYVAIKNLCDYRKINMNKRIVNDSKINNDIKLENNSVGVDLDKKNVNYRYQSYDSIPGFKRTMVYKKVRKRVK